MSKMQKMWDEAHPVKTGQIIPTGAEYLEADDFHGTRVTGTVVAVAHSDLQATSYMEFYLRTLEPLPDHDDTGELDVETSADSIQLYDAERDHAYDLTTNQARNLARKLMEAIA